MVPINGGIGRSSTRWSRVNNGYWMDHRDIWCRQSWFREDYRGGVLSKICSYFHIAALTLGDTINLLFGDTSRDGSFFVFCWFHCSQVTFWIIFFFSLVISFKTKYKWSDVFSIFPPSVCWVLSYHFDNILCSPPWKVADIFIWRLIAPSKWPFRVIL